MSARMTATREALDNLDTITGGRLRKSVVGPALAEVEEWEARLATFDEFYTLAHDEGIRANRAEAERDRLAEAAQPVVDALERMGDRGVEISAPILRAALAADEALGVTAHWDESSPERQRRAADEGASAARTPAHGDVGADTEAPS